MHSLKIILIIQLFFQTEGFCFSLHYCRFQCGDFCESTVITPQKSAKKQDEKSPSAYYWRDFYGPIPPDAYPLGSPNQNPQTYIGLVYDPKKNGTFATTIHEGLDYVYDALDGTTNKISKRIQILCTASPGDLAWLELSKETYASLKSEGFAVVSAGFHEDNKNVLQTFHFIVKTYKNNVAYSGVVNSFNATMEYATKDGNFQSTKTYKWLMYKPNNTMQSPACSNKWFSYQFQFGKRSDSIIPKFNFRVAVPKCSVTCDNFNQKKIVNNKENVKFSASMAYYWQPEGVIDKNAAMPTGSSYGKRVTYTAKGQGIRYSLLDVGSSEGLEGSLVYYESFNIYASYYYQILSSNHQEKFKWVNTTSTDFQKLDKDRLIPGGVLGNGTYTYVCRNVDEHYAKRPGSARVTTIGTFCSALLGPSNTFQVLMYQEGLK